MLPNNINIRLNLCFHCVQFKLLWPLFASARTNCNLYLSLDWSVSGVRQRCTVTRLKSRVFKYFYSVSLSIQVEHSNVVLNFSLIPHDVLGSYGQNSAVIFESTHQNVLFSLHRWYLHSVLVVNIMICHAIVVIKVYSLHWSHGLFFEWESDKLVHLAALTDTNLAC